MHVEQRYTSLLTGSRHTYDPGLGARSGPITVDPQREIGYARNNAKLLDIFLHRQAHPDVHPQTCKAAQSRGAECSVFYALLDPMRQIGYRVHFAPAELEGRDLALGGKGADLIVTRPIPGAESAERIYMGIDVKNACKEPPYAFGYDFRMDMPTIHCPVGRFKTPDGIPFHRWANRHVARAMSRQRAIPYFDAFQEFIIDGIGRTLDLHWDRYLKERGSRQTIYSYGGADSEYGRKLIAMTTAFWQLKDLGHS